MRVAAAIIGGIVLLCSVLLGVMSVHAQKPAGDDAFRLLGEVLQRVRMHYIEKPDDNALVAGAIRGMQREFPEYSGAGLPPLNGAFNQALGKLGDVAGAILEHRSAQGDKARLLKAAIDGMLAELDPQSSYIDAQAFRDMQVHIRGELGSPGIEVAMENGLATVVAAIEDAPAARAGIQTGDIITHIDGAEVRGMSLNNVVGKMRGPVNTRIRFRIVRRGNDAPVEIEIVRETIRIRSVRSSIEEDVGIVRITRLVEPTFVDLKTAIADITARTPGDKLRGYVIDLRNNPGGLFDQAIQVADAFLERGEIVSTRGRDPDENQRFDARPGDLTRGKPMIVLINGRSAAGSEIVAGALQDNRRATLVGTRSFGEGSMQAVIPLGPGNGALRLTTAWYYTPSGRSIHETGIYPDIEVSEDASGDRPLAMALSMLRNKQVRSAVP
jgi:carboxyl-terminal processing protease